MSITAFENLVSTAKRRMLINGDKESSIRLSDFSGIIPAINGKIELVYEGEEQGADQISFNLINEGVKTIFLILFSEYIFTALATAKNVLPVPAGPTPKVIVESSIVSRYLN